VKNLKDGGVFREFDTPLIFKIYAMKNRRLHESDFDRNLDRNLTKFVRLLLIFLVVGFCILGAGAVFALFI
jgi:hypothetical protein